MSGLDPSPWGDHIDSTLQRVQDINRKVTDDIGVEITFYLDTTGGYDPATGEIRPSTDEQVVTVTGEAAVPGQIRRFQSAGGEETEVRVVAWVADDIETEYGIDLITVGEETEYVPTEVEVSPIDARLRILDVFDEGNGLLRLECV